jgi:hypothetical protein
VSAAIAYYLLVIKIRLKMMQLRIDGHAAVNLIKVMDPLMDPSVLSGRPYRVEELADFELQPAITANLPTRTTTARAQRTDRVEQRILAAAAAPGQGPSHQD